MGIALKMTDHFWETCVRTQHSSEEHELFAHLEERQVRRVLEGFGRVLFGQGAMSGVIQHKRFQHLRMWDSGRLSHPLHGSRH